jgi:ribA/ribD-fused uncharacterized protein
MPVVNMYNLKEDMVDVVHIGRPSKWGNPFKMKIDRYKGELPGDREKVVLQYRLWINSQPELLRSLHELKDRPIGCYCAPKKCHGDVLDELANSRYIRNWFSNMLPFDWPMIYQDITFRTIENFYQAMKVPKHNEKGRREIACMNPYEAKKAIRDKDRYRWSNDWNEEKSLEVMEYAIAYKFAPGTSWAKKLLMTEDWEITEWNNWSDTFWGKSLRTEEGENHLGKIIMKQREKLR